MGRDGESGLGRQHRIQPDRFKVHNGYTACMANLRVNDFPSHTLKLGGKLIDFICKDGELKSSSLPSRDKKSCGWGELWLATPDEKGSRY